MPAPHNIDELKERTLEQIFALKRKGVKVSGPKINEYLSDRNLTGPSYRNIMKSTPSMSMINKFKGKAQPHYNNISVLLALNVFIGVHKKKLARAQWADKDYCTPQHITNEIKHVIDVSLSRESRGVRAELRAAGGRGGGGGGGGGSEVFQYSVSVDGKLSSVKE